MPYKFRVRNVSRRYIDDVLRGAVITIHCENEDTGGVSHFTWFAPRADFPAWPPTRAQARDYMLAYMRANAPGSSISRAANMRADTAIIRDDPEVWADDQRDLTV